MIHVCDHYSAGLAFITSVTSYQTAAVFWYQNHLNELFEIESLENSFYKLSSLWDAVKMWLFIIMYVLVKTYCLSSIAKKVLATYIVDFGVRFLNPTSTGVIGKCMVFPRSGLESAVPWLVERQTYESLGHRSPHNLTLHFDYWTVAESCIKL
jgi:hypothetical protein